MPKTNDAIRLLSLEAENFHRLRVAKIRLDDEGKLIRVTGENAAGKTTLLRAVMALFGGDGAVRPDAIREGADGGWVRGELNNGFTLTRKFTEKNPKGYLTIEGPGLMEGTRTKYKQSDVSGWLGDISFDLLALFRLKPRDLRDTLLSLAKDPELRSKLDGIAADRERIREERTPFLSVKQRAERTPKPTGERPEPVDVSGEMAKLAELEAEAERYREARDSGDAAMDAANDATEDLKETEEEIRRLEEQLKDAKDRRMLEVDRMKLLGLAAAKAKDDADKLTDPRDQIATVRARISEADQIRRALAPWDAWERIQTEAKEATSKAKKLTDALASLDAQEKELLAESGIPVDGISFAPDGAVLLNNRDLAVASGFERIRMAFRVAVAANSRLKAVLVDEGNDLGLDGLKELDALCHETGIQGFLCRIGLEGPGEIVVEDGEARNRDAGDEAQETLDF
jgi:predicted  nucleic acid-binding Zn-ribbon protein